MYHSYCGVLLRYGGKPLQPLLSVLFVVLFHYQLSNRHTAVGYHLDEIAPLRNC